MSNETMTDARLRGDDPRSPSYAALLLIAKSVCGALERAGITDCDDPGEAIDVMRERYEARLRAEPEQEQAVAWQFREDAQHNGFDDDDWEECSREEYEDRLAILAGRESAKMAGTIDGYIREDAGGWNTQVRALYERPHLVAGGAVRALPEASDDEARMFDEWLASTGMHVDVNVRGCMRIAWDVRAALSAAPAAPAPLDAVPKGTPTMPPGSFWDGCWKTFPQSVQGYARMLTQSWRAADSTELKNALEAGILALGTASEQMAAPAEDRNDWREAVLDALANTGGDAPASEGPREIIQRVIDFHVAVATDPAVGGAAPVAGVPEGWRLVPEVPTARMLERGWEFGDRVDDQYDRRGAYADLLAAAPQPAAEPSHMQKWRETLRPEPGAPAQSILEQAQAAEREVRHG